MTKIRFCSNCGIFHKDAVSEIVRAPAVYLTACRGRRAMHLCCQFRPHIPVRLPRRRTRCSRGRRRGALRGAEGATFLLAVLSVIACSTPSEPTAVIAAWERSGDWSRNEYAERGFAEYLRRQGIRAESIRMASLDSPVISPDRDAFITFGCIDGLVLQRRLI